MLAWFSGIDLDLTPGPAPLNVPGHADQRLDRRRHRELHRGRVVPGQRGARRLSVRGRAVHPLLAGALILTALLKGRLGRPTPQRARAPRARRRGRDGGFNLAVLATVERIGATNTGVIIGASPVVLALVVPLLARRRPSGPFVVAALVVAAGAAIVNGADDRLTLIGMALAIARAARARSASRCSPRRCSPARPDPRRRLGGVARDRTAARPQRRRHPDADARTRRPRSPISR